MSEAVIVALITGAAAVIGQYLISRKGRMDDRIERAKRDQYLDDQLKVINRKLDEHNGYAKRFEEISRDITEIKTELKHIMP